MTRDDDELDRQLGDWLKANARPMPPRLRTALAETPQRHGQVDRRRWFDRSRLSLMAVGAAVTVVVVIAVALGSAFLDELRQAVGGPSASASNLSSAEPTPSRYEWDAMLNFVDRNPAGDGYGNTTVWTYLSGPAGIHDPTQYQPLPSVEAGEWPTWSDPAIEGLRMALPPGTGRLEIHPAGGGADATAAILAWRNPVGLMPMRIIGSVEVDGSCGDGITLVVAWQSGDQAGEIQTIPLARGREGFDIFLDQVDPGWVAYFKVEPGNDSRCDTTWLTATVHAPATRDDPPPGGE
jgi:hypothetical protein